jgi:DNA-directed RNA polymerase subunit RPC12/RpoP
MIQVGAAPPELPCRLPGGLRVDGSWTRDAALRQLTGWDEEWLAGWDRAVPTALVQSALLERCVTKLGEGGSSPQLIADMLVGDRDYLLLCLRRMSLGTKFDAVTECPQCASRIEVSFDADEIPVEERPQQEDSFATVLVRADGSELQVRYHLPRGRDQARAARAPDADRASVLLASCLEEVEAIKGPGAVAGLLDTAAGQQLELLMEQQAPQVTLDMDLVCPECGHETSRDFELGPFILDELGAGAQRIHREVHSLAYNYHWHEAEILAMPRPRRHVYLGFLLEEGSQGAPA